MPKGLVASGIFKLFRLTAIPAGDAEANLQIMVQKSTTQRVIKVSIVAFT